MRRLGATAARFLSQFEQERRGQWSNVIDFDQPDVNHIPGLVYEWATGSACHCFLLAKRCCLLLTCRPVMNTVTGSRWKSQVWGVFWLTRCFGPPPTMRSCAWPACRQSSGNLQAQTPSSPSRLGVGSMTSCTATVPCMAPPEPRICSYRGFSTWHACFIARFYSLSLSAQQTLTDARSSL